jgi:Sigma-54 interaction domain
MLVGMLATSTTHGKLSPPDPLNFDSAADWRRATASRHTMLLEGAEATTEIVLRLLARYLREPVTWKRRGAPLGLPAGECGTLVLQNIAALDVHDQVRLRLWLDAPTHSTQVVSTTPYSLLHLVDSGLFDAGLYYRLNVVRFFVG